MTRRTPRIRVDEASARSILALLSDEIDTLLEARTMARNRGHSESVHALNLQIRHLRRIEDEYDRTGIEEGWWSASQ